LNLSHTVDAAAQLVAHADCLVHHSQLIRDAPLHAYWSYSRELTNTWMQNLAICQRVLEDSNPIRRRHCWLEYEPDLRDILRADVLHRVWYTILRAADKAAGKRHVEPIARSVLASQMQVRIRCLKLILAGHSIDASRMRSLNQLRKNAEMWSDFLCAHLALTHEVDDIFYNKRRAREWGQQPLSVVFPELRLPERLPASDLNWQMASGIRKNDSLNTLQQLIRKMLDCFPDTAFDKNGLLRGYEK